MFRIAAIAILIATFVAVSGCAGGSSSGSQLNSGSQSNATSVMVTPASASLYQGMTTQFQAKVTGQSNQAVTWSLEQGGVGTIDSTGLYTAPSHDSGGGTFHVVATSQAVPGTTGRATVTMLVPQVRIAPNSVTLAPGGNTNIHRDRPGTRQPERDLDSSGTGRWIGKQCRLLYRFC
jgi:Bacterial Ig-like domain (group 2)